MSVTRIPGFSTGAPKRNLLVVIVYVVVMLLLFSILTGLYDVISTIVPSLVSRAESRRHVSSADHRSRHRTVAVIRRKAP